MGWWGVEIMAGDPALDWEDHFYDLAQVSKFNDRPGPAGINPLPAQALQPVMSQILTELATCAASDAQIGYQVLGVCMMRIGMEIEPEIKALMINAAQTDDWAMEDEERQAIMKQFQVDVETYTGTPFERRSPGLFEKFNT